MTKTHPVPATAVPNTSASRGFAASMLESAALLAKRSAGVGVLARATLTGLIIALGVAGVPAGARAAMQRPEPPAAAPKPESTPQSPTVPPAPEGAAEAGASGGASGDGATLGTPDDVLRGPRVAPSDVKEDRSFVDPAGLKLSRPQIEMRAYFIALDGIALDASLRAKVEELRSAWIDRVQAYEREVTLKRRELEAQRKKAAPDQPPSEEFRKAMDEIAARRPKIAELRDAVAKEIPEPQSRELDKRFEDEQKRIRAEIARRTDEERARRKAEIEKKKDEKKMEEKKMEEERAGRPPDAAPAQGGAGEDDDGMKPGASAGVGN